MLVLVGGGEEVIVVVVRGVCFWERDTAVVVALFGLDIETKAGGFSDAEGTRGAIFGGSGGGGVAAAVVEVLMSFETTTFRKGIGGSAGATMVCPLLALLLSLDRFLAHREFKPSGRSVSWSRTKWSSVRALCRPCLVVAMVAMVVVGLVAVLVCRLWVFRNGAGVLGDSSCCSLASSGRGIEDALSRLCRVVGVVGVVTAVVFAKTMERADWSCSRRDIHF